jgi:hypothetical protein
MVEANKCADAGEVKRLRVVESAGCVGCHGHGLGWLPQELNLDFLPGGLAGNVGFSNVEKMVGLTDTCVLAQHVANMLADMSAT